MRFHLSLSAMIFTSLAVLLASVALSAEAVPSVATASRRALPAGPDPADPTATVSAPPTDALGISMGSTWYGRRITIAAGGGAASVAHGSVHLSSYSNEGNAYWYPLEGPTVSETFTFALQPDGQLLRNDSPWGALDATRRRIIAFEAGAAGQSLIILNRETSYYRDFADDGFNGTWRMHSLEAGAGWKGWKLLNGAIDPSGAFTGTQSNSDGGSAPYSATVAMYYNGEMHITEEGSNWEQNADMQFEVVAFDRITGPSGGEQSGRFDIAFRTGGHFTQSDARGTWWLCGISTTGSAFHGSLTAQADGSYSGHIDGAGSPDTTPISGSLAFTENGVVAIYDSGTALNGQGTLSMDRGMFAFTFSDWLSDSIMLAVKLPAEANITTSLARLHLDWGNGVVLDDTFDLDAVGTACDQPALLVDSEYLTHPALPAGSTMSAMYELVSDGSAVQPILQAGTVQLSAVLGTDEQRTSSQLEPLISYTGTPWPGATGITELSAVFDDLAGDLAATAGNSAASVGIGFEVWSNSNYLGTFGVDMGFLSAFLPRGIYDLPPGHHNRTPCLRLRVEQDGETFYTMPATGFDSAQPVELKLTVTATGDFNAYARFGASEWVHVGNRLISFWPAENVWPHECYFDAHPTTPLSYEPFVRTRVEQIDLPQPPSYMEPYYLPEAVDGDPYSEQFYVSEGGLPPYRWSVALGQLPQGLCLSPDGLLSGVVDEPGQFSFTIRAEDSHSPPAHVDREYDLYVRHVADISGAKLLPAGSMVVIPVAVVTAKDEFGFYAEATDRSAGIRVESDDFVAEGWTVRIIGTTTDIYRNEKSIWGYAQKTGYDTVRPLGMPIRALGGAPFGLDSSTDAGQIGITEGIGLNNLGLLVETWGRVTQIDPGRQFYYIEDGSGLKDGTSTLGIDHFGVRVQQHPLDLKPGDYVAVTGVSSSFSDYDIGVQRVLRACDVRPQFPAAPSFVLGVPDALPGACRIIFSEVAGAAGYELYLSTNGVDFAASTALPELANGYGSFELVLGANTYCRVRSIGRDGIAGGYSEAVYARVMSPQGSFGLWDPYPNSATYLTPSVHWEEVPGAARMGIEIRERPTVSSDGHVAWGVVCLSWNYSVPYGQTADCVTYVRAADALKPGTEYTARVYAVDSANWAFASCGSVPFTTVNEEDE